MAVNLAAPESLRAIDGAAWACTDAAIKNPGGNANAGTGVSGEADANTCREAAARAPIAEPDISGVDIALNDVSIVAAGQPRADYREVDAAAVMARSEFMVHIGLGRGEQSARIRTSDLSYDYVRINAEYRS